MSLATWLPSVYHSASVKTDTRSARFSSLRSTLMIFFVVPTPFLKESKSLRCRSWRIMAIVRIGHLNDENEIPITKDTLTLWLWHFSPVFSQGFLASLLTVYLGCPFLKHKRHIAHTKLNSFCHTLASAVAPFAVQRFSTLQVLIYQPAFQE